MNFEKMLSIALRATEMYKEFHDADPATREVRFLSVLYPDILRELHEDDYFCASFETMKGEGDLPVDFSVHNASQIAYFVNIPLLRQTAAALPSRKDEIEDLIDYWKKESTLVKIREEAPLDVKDFLYAYGRWGLDENGYMRKGKQPHVLGSGPMGGSADCRIAGLMPNYLTLMKLGLPGLREKIAACRMEKPDRKVFYDACDDALDIAFAVCRRYEAESGMLSATAKSEDKRAHFAALAGALSALQVRSPETLFEGMQLMLIMSRLCRTDNHGRMDIYFGDLLAQDYAAGSLDFEGAVKLTMEMWKTFDHHDSKFDSRVLIGGIGRPNEKNADLFALVAIEATRRLHSIRPVVTLRYSKTQNPELLTKAIASIGEGCIYPTLYNDDIYVEGVMKGMHVPYEDALHYAPLGCGEMTLECMAASSPNTTMRFQKILETTLHNGKDGADGGINGLALGEPETFDTYEKLIDAFCTQIRFAIERDVKVQLWQRERAAKEASFLMQSLVMDDCLVRGHGLLDGGLRYFGANIEGFTVSNTANCLAAIKKLVYEEKRLTLRRLVDVLDKNFEGFEEERKWMLDAPKYGNNDPYVDDIRLALEQYINRTADEIGKRNGLSWYTVANVNPGGITIGPSIAAGADGRLCGAPFACGNSPHPGTDVSGMTSMLLSTAKCDPLNGGYVTNMNLSRETITGNPEKFESMVKTYFSLGGLQLNINCFSKGDLARALEHPEEYPNLIVRVSGYSEKFILLDKVTQQHIIDRTLY